MSAEGLEGPSQVRGVKVFKKIKDDQVVELFDRRLLAIRVYLTLQGRPELKDKKFEMPDGKSRFLTTQ